MCRELVDRARLDRVDRIGGSSNLPIPTTRRRRCDIQWLLMKSGVYCVAEKDTVQKTVLGHLENEVRSMR